MRISRIAACSSSSMRPYDASSDTVVPARACVLARRSQCVLAGLRLAAARPCGRMTPAATRWCLRGHVYKDAGGSVS